MRERAPQTPKDIENALDRYARKHDIFRGRPPLPQGRKAKKAEMDKRAAQRKKGK